MKLLIVLLALLFGVWLWRRSHQVSRASHQKKQPRTEPMIACAHCGVHVPLASSVEDANGNHYCCAAHRRVGKDN